MLRIYLKYFAGAPAASAGVAVVTPAEQTEVWTKLTAALGLAGANVGELRRTSEGAPLLAGSVERVHQNHRSRELVLRLEQPGPGVVLVSTYEVKGKVSAVLNAFFYGERAEQHARELQATAKPWLERLLASG